MNLFGMPYLAVLLVNFQMCVCKRDLVLLRAQLFVLLFKKIKKNTTLLDQCWKLS